MNSIRQNPMYLFMMVLVLSASAGYQGWSSMLNNYAVERAHIDGLQIGVVQSLREVPGFLIFLVVFVLRYIREDRLASASLLLMGAGIAVVGYLPGFYGLVATTMLMSVGFHIHETTNKSLTLQFFSTREAPVMFARLRSFGALANIGMAGLVYGMSWALDFQHRFLVVGLLVMLAAMYTWWVDPVKSETHAQAKKLIFKRKYWLFYLLNLLSGARRQIFVVFAIFMLVERFQYTVQDIAVLFVINNLVGFVANPLIGRAINYFGERRVMTLEYTAVAIVFTGYALLDNALLAGILYVLDHIFYNFAIGINTYLQKIADPGDIAPSTSVGFAINHITAVFIPVVGGYIWLYDHTIPFWAGVGLSVVSLAVVQLLRLPKPDVRHQQVVPGKQAAV